MSGLREKEVLRMTPHDSGAVGWMEGHCLEMKNSTGDMLRFRCLRTSLIDDK